MNQFGSDARHILAAPRYAATILKRVVRSIVPSRADFCFIHLADGEQLRCVASAHATRQGQRVLSELGRIYRIRRTDPESTVAQVVRSGRPQLRSEIAVDACTGLSPRVANAHRLLGPRSAIVVPLLCGDHVVGALTLGYADSARRYTAQHVGGAKRLAKQITGCLVDSQATALAVKSLARAAASTRRLLRARV